jgi:drug/metabolite transporter (DMT)-like permease
MIMATTPLWVLLMARIVGIERITVPKLGGMAIAISGVALLQVYRTQGSLKAAGQPATLFGDFMILVCALALAGMTAVGKRHKPRSGGIGLISAGYIGGAILLLPLLWWAARGFDFDRVSWRAWTAISYMGVFSSVTGYLIYLYALARIPASRVAAFQYLQPVFAILMAVVMLGEHLSGAAMLSGGIIFAGVYVTERFG